MRVASLDRPTEIIWADDSKHLCMLGAVPGGYGRLILVKATQPQTTIASAPLPQTVKDEWVVQLLSCSMTTMIAVLAYRESVGASAGSFPQVIDRLVGISFKTAATEFNWDLKSSSGGRPNNVVVSRDSRYFALNRADGSLIQDSGSGTVVGQLPGYTTIAFSWTSSYVAVEGLAGRSGSVMTWSPVHTLWSGKSVLVGAQARPDSGDDMLAAIDNGTGEGQDLFIVHRDGSVTVAARNVVLIS